MFVGETSDWSTTQTITLSNGSIVTVQPTPSPTSFNPLDSLTERPNATALQSSTEGGVLFGLGLWQIAVIMLSVVVIFVAFVVFYLHKRNGGGSVTKLTAKNSV